MKGNEGQTSQISSGRGRGRGGGRGRGRSAPLEGSSAGRGRGRGRGRGNHAGASILSTEVATAKDVLSSNHNVAKSKGIKIFLV